MTTLDNYRNLLRIDKHRLDDELEIQAEMQERISSEVARLNTRAQEAKDELARTEARLLEDAKDRDPKLTVSQLEASVKRHPDRTKAWAKYQAVRETYEEWVGMLDAWKTKGFKLADLGNLFASDYFAVNSLSRDRDRKDRGEDRRAPDDKQRAAIRDASAPRTRHEGLFDEEQEQRKGADAPRPRRML